jgi:hypothetical protein
MLRDGEEAMSIDKSFQIVAPATGKERSPKVATAAWNAQPV